MRKPTDEYLELARRLKKDETERVLARMRTKLMRRLEDRKMSVLEVVAVQLQIEDEALNEWREKWAEIQEKSKAT